MLQAYIKRGQGSRTCTLLKTVFPFSEPVSFTGQQSPKHPLLFRSCIGTSSNYDYPIAHRNTSIIKSWQLEKKFSIVPQLEKGNCLDCCANVDFSKRHFATAKKAVKKKTEDVKIQVKGTTDGVVSKLHFVDNEWETVYRFKYVRLARVIQKIKIYQTVFTCLIALPASLGMYIQGMVPQEVVAFILGSSIFACGMLYVMGRFCSRLIGVLYVSKNDPKLVRVAHLNFWGRREDQIVTKTDFKPFSELPDNVSDLYVNVGFYSDPTEILHMCVRYGTIYEKEEFEEIFGHSGLEITSKENDGSKKMKK